MTGLYSEPGFPHKGWEESDCEDLGEGNYETCQACEKQEIRFVHILDHPDYPESIRVGCVCAENLTEDYSLKSKENLARRCRNFINSKRWEKKEKFLLISYEGHKVMIYKENDFYKVAICKSPVRRDKWCFGEREFSTLHEAKKAAFKGIFYLKERE